MGLSPAGALTCGSRLNNFHLVQPRLEEEHEQQWIFKLPWHNDITGELPAPRDDEPENLRKDIADELSDHLHCALNRELHFTPDEQQAKQNVLTKFGNVHKIARQLWFDWIKEKIMSQRLTLAMTSVMSVVCIVLSFVVWNVAENSREAMKNTRELSNAIIAKLDAFSARDSEPEPRSLEWNPYQVRVVKGTEQGPPAEGFRVELTGDILNASKSITVSKNTGEDGTADFGLVRPGQHQLRIVAPWDEYTQRRITLGPGESRIDRFVSLPDPLITADVELVVNLPEDLKDKNLWTVCSFRLPGREVDGRTWYQSPSTRNVAISPDGRIAYYYDTNFSTEPVTEQTLESAKHTYERWKEQMSARQGSFAQNRGDRGGRSSFSARSFFPAFRNRGSRVRAERIASDPAAQLPWVGAKAILTDVGLGTEKESEMFPSTLNLDYAQSAFSTSGGFRLSRSGSQSDAGQPISWSIEDRTFTIEPGKVNLWTIDLPDSLLKSVRLSLQLAELEQASLADLRRQLPEENSSPSGKKE